VKRKRRSLIDEFLGGSIFEEVERLFDEEDLGESSYSISVTQTPEGTRVYAKVGENVDVGELRRRLEEQYPGALIKIEGGRPLIREISTRPVEEEKREKKSKGSS
jgi:hypothetical protein